MTTARLASRIEIRPDSVYMITTVLGRSLRRTCRTVEAIHSPKHEENAVRRPASLLFRRSGVRMVVVANRRKMGAGPRAKRGSSSTMLQTPSPTETA